MQNNSIVLLSIFTESMIGGVAVHSSNLYDKLVESGVRVEKVDYGKVIAARQRGNYLQTFISFLGLLGRTLRLRFAGHRYFHFHSSNSALPYLLLCLPLYLSGAKMMLSLHSGFGFNKWLDHHPVVAKIDGLAFRLLEALIFMNPEESAAVSGRYPHLRDRIVTINPYIAPKSSVIPHRSDHPTGNTFVVSTIGAWGKRYNVQEAVRGALQFHRKHGVPVRVNVIQSTALVEPDYRERTLAEFEEYRSEIDVELYENTSEILKILAGSDVFIRSSLGDSYGLCVAESLLVGTPAIVTDICRRCNASMLYDPGDYEQMLQYLEQVYADKVAGRRHDNLLDAEEDAFNNYVELYRRKFAV